MLKIKHLLTEKQNLATIDIDQVSIYEMVKLINDEDKKVALAIEKQLKQIANVIEIGTKVVQNGGRIIYFGAGTSGRLGILDVSEMFPTYGIKDIFIALIAGGKKAIKNAVENAEDNSENIKKEFKKIKANKNDLFIGISASGQTSYVIAGLKYAQAIDATSVIITTSNNLKMPKLATITIKAITGPEVIAGSTRMKSGSAQKMILNMISTGIMIKIGKTYGNLMVDLKANNQKLVTRAINLVAKIAKINLTQAAQVLELAHFNVKVAIIMHCKKVNRQKALALLNDNNHYLKKIIG